MIEENIVDRENAKLTLGDLSLMVLRKDLVIKILQGKIFLLDLIFVLTRNLPQGVILVNDLDCCVQGQILQLGVFGHLEVVENKVERKSASLTPLGLHVYLASKSVCDFPASYQSKTDSLSV